jgi:hypothetical protein
MKNLLVTKGSHVKPLCTHRESDGCECPSNSRRGLGDKPSPLISGLSETAARSALRQPRKQKEQQETKNKRKTKEKQKGQPR